MQKQRQAAAAERDALRKISADIKKAVHRISEQCKTNLRSVIDRYPNCISPQRANEGDSGFPRTLRQNNRDPERHDGGHGRPLFGDVLAHHIGNTITAYYVAVLEGRSSHPILKARLRHLQHMANGRLSSMVIQGDDRRGYLLMDSSVYATWVQSGKEIPRGIRPATRAK